MDSKISSPPAAEPLIPDRSEIHLPRTFSRWGLSAVILFAGFVFLAITVAGKGRITLDDLILGQASGSYTMFLLDRPGSIEMLLFLRLTLGWGALVSVTAIVLSSAFFSSRGTTIMQGLLGPIPGMRVSRSESLLAGEILLGILLCVWLSVPISHLVNRLGPSYSGLSFPAWSSLDAVAFWGTLANIAWQFRWNRLLSTILVLLFVLLSAFSIFAMIYLSIAWPTDILGGLFLGGALLGVARSVMNRYV